jgi:hypothetical protein
VFDPDRLPLRQQREDCPVPGDLRDQFLKRALNEILGSDGWRSGTRHGSQWILATDPGTRT